MQVENLSEGQLNCQVQRISGIILQRRELAERVGTGQVQLVFSSSTGK